MPLITPPDRATFRVIKDFTDNNPMEIDVTLSCTTGLILTQSSNISETREVEFVVTSFDEGELNCDVTEEPLEGYSPAYLAAATTGLGLVSTDLQGCHFDEVVSGQFVCRIVNTPVMVDIEIEKQWVFDGSDGSQVDTRYELTLYCDAMIEGGQAICHAGDSEMSAGEISSYQSCKILTGDGSDVFTVQVLPEFSGLLCWVHERVYDHAVEVDNGCEDILISSGTGASCLIINTVYFEGIPTLSQTALAILALLTLSAGLLGFRRML